MPREKSLKDDILEYLKKKGNPVTFPLLYKEFKGYSKNGIRVTVYRLVKEGLVAKASDTRLVSYKAK